MSADDYEPAYKVVSDKGQVRVYWGGASIHVHGAEPEGPRPIDFLIADVIHEAEQATDGTR